MVGRTCEGVDGLAGFEAGFGTGVHGAVVEAEDPYEACPVPPCNEMEDGQLESRVASFGIGTVGEAALQPPQGTPPHKHGRRPGPSPQGEDVRAGEGVVQSPAELSFSARPPSVAVMTE